MPLAERIKRAQQLMQQAGYGPNNRLKTTLAIRSLGPDALRVPAAIQAMWREIYVDVDMVQSDQRCSTPNFGKRTSTSL